MVPAFATAPALLFVAVLMTSGLAEIDWRDITVAAPVTITALTMPLTFSIANGIAFGFIAWVIIHLLAGRRSEVKPAMLIIAGVFVVKFAFYTH
ncbi:MAG TPA: solute carrier family 23 protein, partial [Accumulibacter sp.]|nr:solute carrier family 23 protein [Accumulibacter sp.]